MQKFFVDQNKAAQLNLRKGVSPAEVLAVLPAGTVVVKLGEVEGQPDWWQVQTDLSGTTVTGFVNGRFLTPLGAAAVVAPMMGGLPTCDLPPRGHRRIDGFGQAFPLDEPGMPERTRPDPGKTLEILAYLQPDKPTHNRYLPAGGATFCNIYAHDFCKRMGAFAPRVWWTAGAISRLLRGERVPVEYGTTVSELNANALHDWFPEFGPGFGWSRVFSPDALQSAVNEGGVGIIVAKRRQTNRSGHIVGVVPETPELRAARSGGEVVRPVQSQAGVVNFTAKVPPNRWWLDDRFQSFGFWTHA
jgi:hypothetical protein